MAAKSTIKVKYPYAAIEHRVIDSDAYADLTFSARSLLVMLTRQLSKDNNGRLQATSSYLKKFGFGSQHTLSRAIGELIAHGMIYRTRAGGYQQGAAQYAVTWLTICKDRDGLWLDGFKPCAWRDWVMQNDNLPPAKMHTARCKNGTRTRLTHAKSASSRHAKNAHNELMPIDTWIGGYLERISHVGLIGHQCFEVASL